jgi:hypothetical protein
VSEQAFFWIAGIMAAIVAALGGAFWAHVIADAVHRERTARLEQQAKQHDQQLGEHEAEIRDIRKRWHDFRDGTMKDAYRLFTEWKNEMIAMFRRERD